MLAFLAEWMTLPLHLCWSSTACLALVLGYIVQQLLVRWHLLSTLRMWTVCHSPDGGPLPHDRCFWQGMDRWLHTYHVHTYIHLMFYINWHLTCPCEQESSNSIHIYCTPEWCILIALNRVKVDHLVYGCWETPIICCPVTLPLTTGADLYRAPLTTQTCPSLPIYRHYIILCHCTTMYPHNDLSPDSAGAWVQIFIDTKMIINDFYDNQQKHTF